MTGLFGIGNYAFDLKSDPDKMKIFTFLIAVLVLVIALYENTSFMR
ncbi:MAG: hypothetical protein Q6362_012660 [Candidatus Wukongarchaeota archaeon]|nr:hypothetical protein [Candidatus Wukongarchaeota archaeon]MDO8130261.1 hypothetical protein [Candidatus Wukongarchaeota archaeon]